MLDRIIAEQIYKDAEEEIKQAGRSSFKTIDNMKKEVEKVGLDYSDYFYPEGEAMMFNLKRWKRHFLKEDGDK